MTSVLLASLVHIGLNLDLLHNWLGTLKFSLHGIQIPNFGVHRKE